MSSNPPTDPNDNDDRTILTVRVATPDNAFEKLESRFAALDQGDRPEPMHEVVLANEADMSRLLSPNNVELLRTIARKDPASIRETARLVGRDVRQVHDNLEELSQLNLVRFETEGRSKRPVVWYDDIDVQLPIADETEAAAAS